MTCYFPRTAWRSLSILSSVPDTATKLTKIVFDSTKGIPGTKMSIPCGQCIGCRLDRSRKWAARCMHEAKFHAASCFITLTISDSYPQYTYSLDKSIFVLFLKRLRKALHPTKIRFFHCGEYGKQLQRPHHHMCLFGYDFPDKILHKMSGSNPLYISPLLSRCWPYGYSYIGSFTYDSAMYVAKYILKKQTGKDTSYGDRIPEYVTMSRRPGIGRLFYDHYKSDMYNYDKLVIRHNFVMKPPRYYDNLYSIDFPDKFLRIKRQRKIYALRHKEVSPERLATIAEVQRLRQDKLLRRFDAEHSRPHPD